MPVGLAAGARLPRHAGPRGVRRQREVRINSTMPQKQVQATRSRRETQGNFPSTGAPISPAPSPRRGPRELGLLHGMPAPASWNADEMPFSPPSVSRAVNQQQPKKSLKGPARNSGSFPSPPPMETPIQFRSVAQSCLTLCDPVDCSMPGLPVHHQLPEFTQTHVH